MVFTCSACVPLNPPTLRNHARPYFFLLPSLPLATVSVARASLRLTLESLLFANTCWMRGPWGGVFGVSRTPDYIQVCVGV